MRLYEELSEAMKETISAAEESDEFKARLSKLIENYFENSYADRDINDVIVLTNLTEEKTNGD